MITMADNSNEGRISVQQQQQISLFFLFLKSMIMSRWISLSCIEDKITPLEASSRMGSLRGP